MKDCNKGQLKLLEERFLLSQGNRQLAPFNEQKLILFSKYENS